MILPPTWKIERELRRLGSQIRDLPQNLYNLYLETYFYDQFGSRRVKRFKGKQGFGSRVAIYLIYPSLGLMPSHLVALSYLCSRGYSVKVVSNLPLSESDRALLLESCWAYIERPNFGYDFGGYREAILDMSERLNEVNRLVILNDSTWFPLPGSRDWLEAAENLDVDFAAAAWSDRAGLGTEDYRSVPWWSGKFGSYFHYGSFALFLREKVVHDPEFLVFWRRLALTNRKRQTVERGEVGLTQWMLKRGHSHGCTLDISHLDADLAVMPYDRLRKLASDLIIPWDTRVQAIRSSLLSGLPTRQELISIVITTVMRAGGGAGYSLAAYSIAELGFPFLKKSPVWEGSVCSEQTMRIIDGLGGDTSWISSEALQLRSLKLKSAECIL